MDVVFASTRLAFSLFIWWETSFATFLCSLIENTEKQKIDHYHLFPAFFPVASGSKQSGCPVEGFSSGEWVYELSSSI
jgi:hypothetical protein